MGYLGPANYPYPGNLEKLSDIAEYLKKLYASLISADSKDLYTGQSTEIGSDPTFAKLTLWNNANADFIGSLTLRSGISADYRNYIKWQKYNTTTYWLMGKNATNDFILYSSVNNHHYMYCSDVADGTMRISSRGLAQVMINGHTDSPSSGGMCIYNGGSSPQKIIDFTPAASTFMTIQGSAVSVNQIGEKINFSYSTTISGSTASSIKGLSSSPTLSATSNTSGAVLLRGGEFVPTWTGDITSASASSGMSGLVIYPQMTGSGTLPSIISISLSGPYISNAGVTVTSYMGILVGNPTVASGTLSESYGIYVSNLTSASTNWGIYVAGGNSAYLGNIGLGATSFGTSSNYVLAVKNGTAPSSNVQDTFQMYCSDFAAGNACPTFRTENGTIVQFNQSLLTTDGPTFGHVHITNTVFVGENQVVGARVVDADFSNTPNSGDTDTDDLIDKIRDALITHGLIASA